MTHISPNESVRQLSERLGRQLTAHGTTIAVAESCTAGGLANAIAAVDGASRYLLGGMVTYATTLKERWLGISHTLISTHGVVSEAVAEAMARAIQERSKSDIGVGVTGYIGVSGGDEHAPNGTVCFSIIHRQHVHTATIHVHSTRQENMQTVINEILKTLCLVIEE